MWVKICANTNVEDAQLAIDLGADAVGFVFAPSKRRVTPDEVGRIVSGLSEGADRVERIGVFQGVTVGELIQIVRVSRLTGVQLHGRPELDLIASVRREFGAGLTIIQTLHWPVGGSSALAGQELAEQVKALSVLGQVDRILVDAKVGDAVGGTGQKFDWNEAVPLFGATDRVPMIVAGGLSPSNVREAIDRLSPWGVDVASGVERMAGRKDPEAMRLFIERAHGEQRPAR